MQLTDHKAIIIDATGTELSKEEQDLLKSERPAGFILFKRNCVSKQQVKELVASVRECVGWDGLPVLIDQEGGSVSRLKQPEWTEYPAAKIFGELANASEQEGRDAARINSYLMALDLADLGISVNCAPVVDVPAPDCHEFLAASRTYSNVPEMVGRLGEAVCRGLLDGGITPVIKHIPGHGRAKVDSHLALPATDAPLSELSEIDFKPFKYLSSTDMKTALWAMAAHVVFSSVDPDSAATLSARVVADVIRGEIGFNGVLLADDISMKALGGTLESRVKGSMASGMDLTMLCNASFEDRVAALQFTPKLTAEAAQRVADAETQRTKWLKKGNDNRQELQAKLEQLIEKRRIG
ncbi:MAG TPA: beta-N-acetylhexosaminidase [Patescibacteria group bacterium]|nr:beta-N-acetylhexosaminidase [Patescibacteria group bacterium]